MFTEVNIPNQNSTSMTDDRCQGHVSHVPVGRSRDRDRFSHGSDVPCDCVSHIHRIHSPQTQNFFLLSMLHATHWLLGFWFHEGRLTCRSLSSAGSPSNWIIKQWFCMNHQSSESTNLYESLCVFSWWTLLASFSVPCAPARIID